MSSDRPPIYEIALKSDSSQRRIHRIIEQTFSRGTDFSANVSQEAEELAWFLIDILAMDYDYRAGWRTSSDQARRRKRYRKLASCLMHICWYNWPLFSANSAVSIDMLQRTFHRPAQELGILPGVIDTVLHRYFKYSPKTASSIRYKGCVYEVRRELGVGALAEKISWDWIHLSRCLERFSAGSEWSLAAHYQGMLKVTQKMLPGSHPTRYLMEYTSQPNAGIDLRDIPGPRPRLGWSLQELQELLAEGDRWVRETQAHHFQRRKLVYPPTLPTERARSRWWSISRR